MNKHDRKILAPTIITAIMIVIFVFEMIICLVIPIFFWVKVLMAVVPLALTGVSIFCLVERIKEIRSGEEDDLSKY